MKIKLIFFAFLILFVTSIGVQAQNWKSHSFEEARFKMLFPSTPKNAKGKDTFSVASQSSGMAFRVITHLHRKFDIKNANVLLKESVNSFFNTGDKIIRTKENFKIEGYPTREVEVRTAKNLMIVFRCIITPTKLYQFVVAGTQSNYKKGLADKFLNSFNLL